MARLSESEGAADSRKRQPKETTGEHLFNAFNWFGIGWLLNAGISVLATEAAENRPGNPLYSMRSKAVESSSQFIQEQIHNAASQDLRDVQQTFLDSLGRLGDLDPDSQERVAGGILEHFVKDGAFNEGGKFNQAFHQLIEQFGGESTGYEGLAEALNEAINTNELGDVLGSGDIEFTAEKLHDLRDHMLHLEVGRDSMSTLATIITLCIGGFVLMGPIKLLEDRKRDAVEWTDNNIVDPVSKLFGQGPKNERDAQSLSERRQARYDEISAEPPQTWGSVLGGRFAALLPIYAFHIAMAPENNIVKLGGQFADQTMNGHREYHNPDPTVGFGGVGHYLGVAGDAIGDGLYDNVVSDGLKEAIQEHAVTEEFANNVAPGADPAQEWFRQKASWLTLDFSYSLVAATSTFFLSHLFAQSKEQPTKKNNIAADASRRFEVSDIPDVPPQQPTSLDVAAVLERNGDNAQYSQAALLREPLPNAIDHADYKGSMLSSRGQSRDVAYG